MYANQVFSRECSQGTRFPMPDLMLDLPVTNVPQRPDKFVAEFAFP
jgi:hypothetical protein